MLDQETKKEVVEDILLHYGVKGMKWKKEKKKEEVKDKMNKLFDKTNTKTEVENEKDRKYRRLQRKVEYDVENKERSNRERKQNTEVALYVRNLSKKLEVRRKEKEEWKKRQITKKIVDKLKGKKAPKYPPLGR